MAEIARLLILVEEKLIGRGLASLLGPRYDTHQVESFERAARLLGSRRAEVALWLGDRVDPDTAERLTELRSRHPHVGLCLLARDADSDTLRSLLARAAGGTAVLLRTDELDVDELMTALDDVLAGKSTLEPSLLEDLLRHNAAEHGDALDALTPAERETLELVSLGLRNREIARRLWKSEKAIEKQVSHVFAKLGLDPDSTTHLDRRVTAARIFFACRPTSVGDPRPAV